MSKGLKVGLIILGIVIVILIVLPFALRPMMGWQGDRLWGTMGPGMMGSYGFGFLMPVVMIVFWGLIIWGIVAMVRYFATHNRGVPDQNDSALEILKRRYAKGEISKQEYEEKKKDLM
jgi:putative membrane protein